MKPSPNSDCSCNGEQMNKPLADTPCCGSAVPSTGDEDSPSPRRWVLSCLPTASGEIPVVSTRLSWADTLAAWKARWRIGRMRYLVEPGLYAVGKPDAASPVMVTANYKMSFDRLRSSARRNGCLAAGVGHQRD